MSAWEISLGASDEWYTPRYIFDALGCAFLMDVAAPIGGGPHVPASHWLTASDDCLAQDWHGMVWMNPPFGGRNGLIPWLDRFFSHGNGIALTPDRTSAPWWQDANRRCDATLFVAGKIKFERPDGSVGKSPGTGTTLFAVGAGAVSALLRAETRGLGTVMERMAA
ncbi:phage N-6-adenine-methyltransferase [Falsirhodobacter halotolerans]|uniref:phage N-6-adenine-methyltransferase n=1 Tax=Falsirhodobacter halotolerans TaxID=1146892 RepID=UPI001FD0535C|nr:phage N-6-adenine-methyltransferase [Falsirhodobacter halotolerans]MCJ8138403.1 phage N-6-adenine-methyltransferase [Falsirhodobacter halotolerans]